MHHRLRMCLFQGCYNVGANLEISGDECGTGINRLPVALGQVVKHGDLVSEIEELLDTNTADIAGSAGNENFHNFLHPGFNPLNGLAHKLFLFRREIPRIEGALELFESGKRGSVRLERLAQVNPETGHGAV